jgi:hypothetical protein
VSNRTTPLVQHGFAQPLGIAFSRFGKLGDLVSDHVIRNVAAINKPKGYECRFVGKTHEPDCFRVESFWDRIGICISRDTGESATELSVTDA